MQEEEQFTREKQESLLIHRYNKALDLLQGDDHPTGRRLLEDLLEDGMLKEGEFTYIRFGVFLSLGEYLSQTECHQMEEQIITWNYSVFYLNKSNEIQEQLHTLRQMAAVTRKLGFFPKSINLYVQALQLSTNLTQQLPIMFQIAQLCFLVDDRAQFNHIIPTLMEQQFQTTPLNDIIQGFNMQNNATVNALLDEKMLALEKLELNPFHRRDNALMRQIYASTLNLNKSNFQGFLKSILESLKVLINRKRSDDIQGVSNTEICIKIVKGSTTPKQKIKRTPKIKGASRRKRNSDDEKSGVMTSVDDIIHQQADVKLAIVSLQQLLFVESENFIQLFQLVHHTDKIQVQEIQVEITLVPQEETQSTIQFINDLEQTSPFLTLIHLTDSVLQHFFQHDYMCDSYYGPSNLRRNKIPKYLTKILVYHYQLTNLPSNPFTLITMLELLYEAFKHNNTKVDYTPLISRIKFEVLHLVTPPDDASLRNHYLIRYYNINALIHSDPTFLHSKLAKHCALSLDNLLTIYDGKYQVRWLHQTTITQDNYIQTIQERINVIKQQTQVNHDVEALILNFEDKQIDLNETTEVAFHSILDSLKSTPSKLSTCLMRICTIYLSVLDSESSRDGFKRILIKIDKYLHMWDMVHLTITSGGGIDLEFVALFCLKVAVLKSALDMDDFAKYLQIFAFVYLKQTKDMQVKGQLNFILMSLIQHSRKNLEMFFSNSQLYQMFMRSLIDYYHHSQKQFQIVFQELLDNFETDEDLQYFIVDRINFSTQQDNIYNIVKSDMQEEQAVKKKSQDFTLSAESGCDELSCQSEDPYYVKDDRQSETKFVQLTIADPNAYFQINAKRYKLTKTTKRAMKSQIISINLNAVEVQDEIKKIARKRIKANNGYLMSEQNRKAQIIIENYIIHQHVISKSLEFLGVFMPNIYKDTIPKEIGEFLEQKVAPLITKNDNESLKLLQGFLNKNSTDNYEEEIKVLTNHTQMTHIHLHFMLGRFYQRQPYKDSQYKALDHFQMCVCQDLKNMFFLTNLYNHYYELASLYFAQQILIDFNNQKKDYKMCFISQKKLYALIEHVDNQSSTLRPIKERLLVMNLLKFYERKWSIRDPMLEQNPLEFTSALQQKAYDIVILLNGQYSYHLPRTTQELCQEGIRVHILVEKYVRRKIRTIEYGYLVRHLDNLRILGDLCTQIDKMSSQELFLEQGYEKYLQIEYHISIYKFCLRFIKLLQHCVTDKPNYIPALIENLEGFLRSLETEPWNQVQTQQYEPFKLIAFKPKDEIYFQSLGDTLTPHKIFHVDSYYERISRVLVQSFSIIQSNKVHKKFKYKQSPVLAQYYMAHYQFNLLNKIDLAYQTISEFCIPASADLVQIYKIYDKQNLEKDPLFDKFLNNDSVFLYEKFRVLKLYTKILLEKKNLDQLNVLLKRLAKVQIVLHEEQPYINRSFGYSFMNTSISYFSMLILMLQQTMMDESTRASIQAATMIAFTTIKKHKICNKYIQQHNKLYDTLDSLLVQFYLHATKDDSQDAFDVQIVKALNYYEAEAKKKPKKTQ